MAIFLRDLIDNVTRQVCSADPKIGFEDSELSRCGLFYGAGGLSYFLLQLSEASNRPDLLEHADRFCSFAERAVEEPFPDVHRETHPLVNLERSVVAGSGGVGYIRALLAARMGKPDGIEAGIQMFVNAWHGTRGAWNGAEAKGGDAPFELHLGAAGFTCAASDLLECITDLKPDQRNLLTSVQQQSGGRVLENLERPFPGRTNGVGMAHGVAGQLYACIRAGLSPKIIARRMDELIELAIDQPPLIQWPTSLDSRQLDWLPASFCRGLSGVLILLCAAAKALGSERYAEYAARAAFMLRKVHYENLGMCCGLAGQAVAVSHYAALSGCPTSRRWARTRLRRVADGAFHLPALETWQGQPGIALAALAVSGRGALPLIANA